MPPEVIKLTSKTASLDVTIADAPISWDITEAPGMTLTVPDPQRLLSFSPGVLGDGESDLIATVYDRPWRVTETSHDDLTVTLTLEHSGAWGMRNLRGPVSAPTGATRPQFASMLWARSRAGRPADVLYTPLINPEAAGYKPPVFKDETPRQDREAQKVRDKNLAPGFKPNAAFKIQGKAADAEQKRVLSSALSVADDLKAPRPAKLALVEALIVESACRNLTYGDASSTGPLQLLSSTARGLSVDPRDVAAVCRLFLSKGFYGKGGAIAQARRTPGKQSGQIAQDCQGSAHPERYQAVQPQAQAILAAWSGSDGTDATAAGEKGTTLALGEDEDGWTGFKRLGTDSQRRAYCTLENVVFATDNQQQASRPLLELYRRAPGVRKIGPWRADANLQVDAMPFELTCSDDVAWQLAGHTVSIVGEGDGDGLWLVTKWSRSSRADRFVSFEAERLRPYLPESKIAQATQSASGSSGTSSISSRRSSRTPTTITTRGGAKGIVDQAFAIAHAAGGSTVYVGSSSRPGSTTTSGNVSDHSSNDASRAARDIGKRNVDLLVGPPSAELDKGVVAIGKAFGKSYGNGARTIIDTFTWKGFRVQIIWRTPLYGGHMGHIHIGVRRL